MRRVFLLTLLGLLALTASGCGEDDEQTAAPGETTPSVTGASRGGAVPFDRAFIDGMVPHHEGAIEMAKAAKAAGLTEPQLVEIAADIIATQQREIDQMKAWRAEWFGSSEIDPMGAEALGLSEAEMGMQHDASTLESAADVDAAFAAMMIDHHNGAIAMAQLATKRGEHEEIRALANDIIRAQEREVAVMEKYAPLPGHEGHS